MTASVPADADNTTGGDTPRTFADKINHLFDVVRKPDGTTYSNEEVAAQMATGAGEKKVSRNYIWMLRTGERDNPTKKHLEALATFFSVKPAYFFDEEISAAIFAELSMLKLLKESRVGRLAMRLDGLDERSIETVTHVIESLRVADGLPPNPETSQR